MKISPPGSKWLIPGAILLGFIVHPVLQHALGSLPPDAAPLEQRSFSAETSVPSLPSSVEAESQRILLTHTKTFGVESFERLLRSPAVKLHPDLSNGTIGKSVEPALVVFTWGECPSCTLLRKHFEAYKDKYPFQVFFTPIGNIGGNPKLDRSVLQYLALEAADEGTQAEALAGARFASQVLSAQTGALKVPAFAWRVGDEIGCGNLSGPELDAIITKMRSAVNERGNK